MTTGTTLATPAWLMAGRLRNVPGVLAAGDGKLTFVTDDGPVFAVSCGEVGGVTWPWYWFGGGCKIRVGETEYKITFVRPNGAADVAPSLLDVGAALGAALADAAAPTHSLRGLADIRSGRRAAAAWKEALPA
jgi:hypothetical protein